MFKECSHVYLKEISEIFNLKCANARNGCKIDALKERTLYALLNDYTVLSSLLFILYMHFFFILGNSISPKIFGSNAQYGGSADIPYPS